MPEVKFTKSAIAAIQHPKDGQVLYRDSLLRGFGLRIGSRSKVFFAEGQVSKRTRRVTIGRADVLSVDDARKMALKHLSDMAAGIDPNAEKRRQSSEMITLAQASEAFFVGRSAMSVNSVDSYRRSINFYLKDWRAKSITTISRQAILKRHQRIAKDYGKVTANNVMRHLRSIYNYTAATQDEFPENPVSILTQARAWFPERRRRNAITAQQLPAWWDAVMAEPEYSRDFLLVALFTGMRRAEIGSLRWEYIDLDAKALHVPKTKNGDPLDLPLSDFLVDLLARRRADVVGSPWVFPGRGRKGHIVETKKFTARVGERCGVAFTLHDLRRTFITIAESLDIPHYALKRMLNHRTAGDVTGGYIVINAERLREPVDLVAQKVLALSVVESQQDGVAAA